MKQVWYVRGEQPSGWPTLFDSKELAEKYARELFPNEDPDTRYGRIYYRDLYTQEDLQ